MVIPINNCIIICSFISDYGEMPECSVGPDIHIWSIPVFTQLETTKWSGVSIYCQILFYCPRSAFISCFRLVLACAGIVSMQHYRRDFSGITRNVYLTDTVDTSCMDLL